MDLGEPGGIDRLDREEDKERKKESHPDEQMSLDLINRPISTLVSYI